MPIDFTKPVQTMNGCAARVLCTDLHNPVFPVAEAAWGGYFLKWIDTEWQEVEV